MSRHEDIDNAIWSDPDFLELSAHGKLVYIWSWTNPRCGMAGVYKVSLRQAALEVSLTVEEVEDALRELEAARFVIHADGVLFVRSRVRHLRQKTSQIATSIARDVAKLPDEHPVTRAWFEHYGAHAWLRRALSTVGHETVAGQSGEGHQITHLEPENRGSTEGRSTLHGNGNGNGHGKGPQGRGVGRGSKKPAAVLEAEQWARDHFPETEPEIVLLVARQVHEDGQEITPATVRAALTGAPA